MRNQPAAIRFCMLGFCGIMLASRVAAGQAGKYLGPCALGASKDGKTLYIANAGAKQIVFLDLQSGRITQSINLSSEPTGLALSPDKTELYVTCAGAPGTVLLMDAASGKVDAKITAGHTACGPAVTPDGKRLYVCNRFDNNVSVIDLGTRKELTRVPAVREPLAAALTPDGELLLVVNHLPADRADAPDVAGAVTIIHTRTNQTATIRLPNGALGLRGVCVSPDGKYAYVTHIIGRYELPAIQVDFGWMNANALSVIDTRKEKLVGTVLLDDKYLGAANPWGVACTADGKWICVSHAGTSELSVIDAPALLKKLVAMPERPAASEVEEVVYDDRNELLDYFRRLRAALEGKDERRELYILGSAAGVSNDLTFLAGLRRRIRLKGKGPRGLAVVGSKAYVAEYFSDTLSIVELEPKSGKKVYSLALGPKPQLTIRRRGEMLFNDGELCFQHWQSCASCHPDARMDGLNWDLTNDGMGNLKNTKSLLLAHKTPPAMSSGVRASAEVAVRAGIKHILFTKRSEENAVAIDTYLKSLQPVPSPHLLAGRLSPAAQRGKKLFFSGPVGCSECHPGALYTDMRMYNVGSKGPCDRRREFDTTTLIEVWRTAPYLHDGRYTTVRELVTKGRHGKKGSNFNLTKQEINDLVEFVLSL